MKKRYFIIFILFAIVLLITGYLFYCYISVHEIYNAVEYAFLMNNGYDIYLEKYMTNDIFISFNEGFSEQDDPNYKKDFSLKTIFYLNDFFSNGIIWMEYTIDIKDERGKEISGAYNVPITLFLKKNDGVWKIVKKDEYP